MKGEAYKKSMLKLLRQYEKRSSHPKGAHPPLVLYKRRPRTIRKNVMSQEKYLGIIYYREFANFTLERTANKFGLTRTRVGQITYKLPTDETLPVLSPTLKAQ